MAKNSEGGEENLKLLERVTQLRYELAQLHGQPDFATLQLKRRMAQTPEAVYQFLGNVQKAALQLQEDEFADLRAEKAKLEGTPVADTRLARWDVNFLKERVRKARYSVDQEALRAYFPTEASLQYAMHIASLLYGIEFVKRDVPVWHADVRYYDVYDRSPNGKRGAFIGGIYLDLFPREGKYNHAAAFGVRKGSTLAHRTPISALVTNFNSKGLNHDELETLLHEFGHVLHGVLSKARYAEQSGTSVKRDFVEAPSQMFEEWASREDALALFRTICPTCPQLTSQQIRQLEDARRFGRGQFFSRQGEYALYDMKLHTGKPGAPMPLWIAIEKAGALGHVDGSMFPAGFGHVMGGYAAGYYGYMWSQVLALDMLSAFDGKLLNPVVGRRYRDVILRTAAKCRRSSWWRPSSAASPTATRSTRRSRARGERGALGARRPGEGRGPIAANVGPVSFFAGTTPLFAVVPAKAGTPFDHCFSDRGSSRRSSFPHRAAAAPHAAGTRSAH